ncbi:MBL fold metallo-hydrolase [Candidatus Saccharibacteria bacterium]|nr:MBL fold metallo-hydrolase [Candidatus Saccharibacteria bacterium]
MEIEYRGANCIVFKTKNDIVLVDPTSNTGLKDYGEKAIVLFTDEKFIDETKQSGFIISQPGEYEKGEVSVRGIAVRRYIDPEEYGKQATMYRVELGGVRVAVLGHITNTIDEDSFEALGVVDIVIIPVGDGGYTLDAKDASAIIHQIGPRVVVPTHFDDGTKYEVPQNGLETFVKEFGGLCEDKGASFKIKNIEELPEGPAIYSLIKS